MSKRLTSVTLMPDVYVDGIPTIEFESAKYVKQVWSQAEGWHDAPIGSVNKRVYIISNNSAQAQYRLNPASIQEEDIQMDKLAYVTRKATTRADETVDDIVKVASNGTKVSDNGILTVKLAKSNTESLNDYNLDANQIYTVSLKVPVAAKHLFKDQARAKLSFTLSSPACMRATLSLNWRSMRTKMAILCMLLQTAVILKIRSITVLRAVLAGLLMPVSTNT